MKPELNHLTLCGFCVVRGSCVTLLRLSLAENATVQHILKLSQQASREVHQQYTVVTFGLAVAKKAYSLV